MIQILTEEPVRKSKEERTNIRQENLIIISLAIIGGMENQQIQFSYKGKGYWIAHTEDGLSHLSDDAGNTQFFGSCKELFSNARINGESLNDIWEKVIVKNC